MLRSDASRARCVLLIKRAKSNFGLDKFSFQDEDAAQRAAEAELHAVNYHR